MAKFLLMPINAEFELYNPKTSKWLAVWFSLWVQLFCLEVQSRSAYLLSFFLHASHGFEVLSFFNDKSKALFLRKKMWFKFIIFWVKMNDLKIPLIHLLLFFLLWIFFYLCNKGNLFLIGSRGKNLGSVCTVFLPTAKMSNLNHKPLKIVRREGSLITLKLVLRLTIRTLSVKATWQLHWLRSNKQ